MSDDTQGESASDRAMRRGRRRPPTIDGSVQPGADTAIDPVSEAKSASSGISTSVQDVAASPSLVDEAGKMVGASEASSDDHHPAKTSAVLEGGVSDAMLEGAPPAAAAPSARPRFVTTLLAASLAGLVGGGLVVGIERAMRQGGDVAASAAQAKRMADLEAQLSALQKARSSSESASAAASPSPSVDDATAQRLAALEDRVTSLAAIPPAAPTPNADVPPAAPAIAPQPPVDLGPLQQRLGGIEEKLTSLAGETGQAAAAAKDARAAADAEGKARTDARASADALAARVNATEAQLKNVSVEQGVLKSAPTLAVVASIRSALALGRPFAADMSALEALGTSAEILTPLKAVAGGAPTALMLADQLRALNDRIATPAAKSDASFAEKLFSHATSLVKVAPAGDAAGASASARAARAQAALRRDDLATAKAELDALPPEAQPLVADVKTALRTRTAAQDALSALETDAVASITAAKPRS